MTLLPSSMLNYGDWLCGIILWCHPVTGKPRGEFLSKDLLRRFLYFRAGSRLQVLLLHPSSQMPLLGKLIFVKQKSRDFPVHSSTNSHPNNCVSLSEIPSTVQKASQGGKRERQQPLDRKGFMQMETIRRMLELRVTSVSTKVPALIKEEAEAATEEIKTMFLTMFMGL